MRCRGHRLLLNKNELKQQHILIFSRHSLGATLQTKLDTEICSLFCCSSFTSARTAKPPFSLFRPYLMGYKAHNRVTFTMVQTHSYSIDPCAHFLSSLCGGTCEPVLSVCLWAAAARFTPPAPHPTGRGMRTRAPNKHTIRSGPCPFVCPLTLVRSRVFLGRCLGVAGIASCSTSPQQRTGEQWPCNQPFARTPHTRRTLLAHYAESLSQGCAGEAAPFVGADGPAAAAAVAACSYPPPQYATTRSGGRSGSTGGSLCGGSIRGSCGCPCPRQGQHVP
jgi:hypothetical protein